MLNPIFWKKVQGQKHTGRWGIVEHQIPNIKVLFKTNAKSHKHPGIKLLSSESKTQLVNQRKQNSYRRAYIYIYIHINTELLDGNKGHHMRKPMSKADMYIPIDDMIYRAEEIKFKPTGCHLLIETWRGFIWHDNKSLHYRRLYKHYSSLWFCGGILDIRIKVN